MHVHFRKSVLTACLLSLGLVSIGKASDSVVITEVSWEAGKLIAASIKDIIESSTEVKVDIKLYSTDDSFKEMSLKNGLVDIFPDLWMPNQEKNWGEYVNDKQTVLSNENPYNAEQGIYIVSHDRSLSGPSLTDIAVLKEAKFIAQFDSDGNGKGEYWPGAPKWGARDLMRVKFNSYGLNNYWEEIDATHENFIEHLKIRYERNIATLFYYWKPEWLFENYETSKIREPQYTEGCKNIVEKKEENWFENSHFDCEFPKTTVHVLYSKRLTEDHPLIAEKLKHLTISVDNINEALYKLNVLKEDFDSVVKHFSKNLTINAHNQF